MNIKPIHRAPYTNFHDLNLDWIIEVLNEFNTKLTNFVSLATIKYANPIQWDVTSQYEANTVVVDSNGNAYLSVQPVPSGVSLDRTQYWTKIGNFDELWSNVKKAITPIDEGHSATATAARAIDDLVWVNGLLVRITAAMKAGDAYVPGSNCVSSSTNEVLHYLLTTFNERLTAEQTTRENADNDLQTAIDTEKQARGDADSGLQTAIDTEKQARGDADSGLQTAIEAEQTARENADNGLQNSIEQLQQDVKQVLDYANVKSYGAKGDGTTDDTIAFSTAIASGKDLFIPDGEYIITGAINIGSPLMTSGAIIIAQGVTITMSAPVAPCCLHFKRTKGGKYKVTGGLVLGDWFIDTGLADVFRGGALTEFTGTIKFPSPGSWSASNNTVTADTPYRLTKKVLMASHIRYDFCGGVIAFDAANACISASDGFLERTWLVNATLCATVETVQQFTEVVGAQRIFFDSLHCVGGRRVGFYKNTINVQVSNIFHDTYYTSTPTESYCSFVIDETSAGPDAISGNASIRFFNCNSSMLNLTCDSSQFIIYNSNDIRDIYIDNCECSHPHFGIQINSTGAALASWNIFIRGYTADQCERCIYCTNLGRGQVTIDNGYFNAWTACIEFVNSSATVSNSLFLGDRESKGIVVTSSSGVILTTNQFINMDHPISVLDGYAGVISDNVFNRNKKWANDYAIKITGTSSQNRVTNNTIIPYTADYFYLAGIRFEGACSNNVMGLNTVAGTELSNEEADLQKISTVPV
jgi:septum formation inhibitor MinC